MPVLFYLWLLFANKTGFNLKFFILISAESCLYYDGINYYYRFNIWNNFTFSVCFVLLRSFEHKIFFHITNPFPLFLEGSCKKKIQCHMSPKVFWRSQQIFYLANANFFLGSFFCLDRKGDILLPPK